MTKAQLAVHHIYNPYTLAETQEEPRVWVGYCPYPYSGWGVFRVGYRTGDYSNKTFRCSTQLEKELRRKQAIAWATERSGIDEWEKSPFGSWHPKGTMAKIEQWAIINTEEESNDLQ